MTKRGPLQAPFCEERYLKIADLDPLSHFPQALGQFLHQIHLDVEIDGQVRILVGRIHRPADEEIDIRSFLKSRRLIWDAPSFRKDHCS